MLTTLLFSLFCAFAPAAVVSPETTAAPDTTAVYIIDNEQITASEFDGSQLVGQRIVAYRIDTLKSERVILLHSIDTERGSKQPDTMGNHIIVHGNAELLYIVDGAVQAEKDFKSLDPWSIQSVTVLKGDKAVKQYGPSAKNGAIIVQTKKSSK